MRLRALCFALACASCLDPTQATLEISTNVACGDTGFVEGTFFECGVLAAGTPEGLPDAPHATTRECTPGPNESHDIGTMVIFPEDGATTATVIVIGTIDDVPADQCVPFAKGDANPPVQDPCIVAKRTIAFAGSRDLRIPILLDSACAGFACPGNTTCVKSGIGVACVDAEVTCKKGECRVPENEGGAAPVGPYEVVYEGPIRAHVITGLMGDMTPRIFIAGTESIDAGESLVQLDLASKVDIGSVVADMPQPVTGIEARQDGSQKSIAATMAMNVMMVDPDGNFDALLSRSAVDAVPLVVGQSIGFVDASPFVFIWDGGQVPVADMVSGNPVAIDAAGPDRIVVGGPGTCFLSEQLCLPAPVEHPVIDIWTATGAQAFTISEGGQVNLALEDPPTIPATAQLPLGGGAISLKKIKGHQIGEGPTYAVWVGGSVGGAAYLAHGQVDNTNPSAFSFVELPLPDLPAITDLWAENRPNGRVYAVVNDGRVISVMPP